MSAFNIAYNLLKKEEPIRYDGGAFRNVDIYPKRVVKYPIDGRRGGRAQPKTDVAISHALASLGYPIVPEYPIEHPHDDGRGRGFPVEQKKIDMERRPEMKNAYEALLNDPEMAHLNLPTGVKSHVLDYLLRKPPYLHEGAKIFNETQANALRDKLTEMRDKRAVDFRELHETMENNDLTHALDVGDMHEYNIGRDPDDPSKFVTFDPMYGRTLQLESMGKTLGAAASAEDIGQDQRSPISLANVYRDLHRAKKNNPIQFDVFNTLYGDTDIFQPWEKEAEETLHNPDFETRNQTSYDNEREYQQKRQAADDADYKTVGSAFNFINVPDEQRRLFEYDTGVHGELYRDMLRDLQNLSANPYTPPQQFRDFREGGPSPVQKSEDEAYKYADDVSSLVNDGRKVAYGLSRFDPMVHDAYEDSGANRFAIIGDNSVEKYPFGHGRAENKKDLAIFNALASLGYPIVPEQPMAFDRSPRFFPTEQDKTSTHLVDNYAPHISNADAEYVDKHGIAMPEANRVQYRRRNKKVNEDLTGLREVFEQDPLAHTLDIGDVKFGNVGYDDSGKMVTFDPYLGSHARLPEFGRRLDVMAAPIRGTTSMHQSKPVRPNYLGNHDEKTAADQAFLYQGFQQIPQTQKDSFRQLYHDQEQFSPWQAAEEKLYSDPEAFGEHAPTAGQREQMLSHIDRADEAYKRTGRAIDWLTTPPEQKRLYEFGNNQHAQRYRNMMTSLNRGIFNTDHAPNWMSVSEPPPAESQPPYSP